jgi:hypothetical protein
MRTYKGLKEWNKYQPSTDKSSNIVSGTQTELKQRNYCSPYLLVKSSSKYQGSLLVKRILKEESDKRNGSQNKYKNSLLAVAVILVMYLIMFGLLTIRLRIGLNLPK